MKQHTVYIEQYLNKFFPIFLNCSGSQVNLPDCDNNYYQPYIYIHESIIKIILLFFLIWF